MKQFGRSIGRKAASAVLAGFVLHALAGPAAAQAIDPADVTFWQSIQSSQNAAEYQAYLAAFPNGVFAELARLRLQALGGGTAPVGGDPAPGPAPAADNGAAPSPGGVVGDATLTVEPSAPRVGDIIKVTAIDLPNVPGTDSLIVVPAGTPERITHSFDEGVLVSAYAAGYRERPWEAGQFPPGAYEVRWITTLYSLKKEDQIGARTSFEVSR